MRRRLTSYTQRVGRDACVALEDRRKTRTSYTTMDY